MATKFQIGFGIVAVLFLARLGPARAQAGTLAKIETSLGTMELELYDDDKPITVSNFVKYVTSGRYTNQFVQRWEPNFVIQAGGFRVTNTSSGLKIATVSTFGTIRNEYKVGKTNSNTYGTIAMARQGGVVNSASSQWFLNLKDNSGLDKVDEGFTVFGKVTSGANVLNLFIPPPTTNATSMGLVDLGAAGLTSLPVRKNITSLDELFPNLIYLTISLRRDLNLAITATPAGERQISWQTIAGVTNTLQYSSNGLTPAAWKVYTNVVGNGSSFSLIDPSTDPERLYRVTLEY